MIHLVLRLSETDFVFPTQQIRTKAHSHKMASLTEVIQAGSAGRA